MGLEKGIEARNVRARCWQQNTRCNDATIAPRGPSCLSCFGSAQTGVKGGVDPFCNTETLQSAGSSQVHVQSDSFLCQSIHVM